MNIPSIEIEAHKLQAQCRRGFPREMIDDSNNLHAECYGFIGKLLKAFTTEYSTVERVWKALGISTFEQTQGKAIDEIVAKLKADNEIFEQSLRAIYKEVTGVDPADGQIHAGQVLEAVKQYRAIARDRTNRLADDMREIAQNLEGIKKNLQEVL